MNLLRPPSRAYIVEHGRVLIYPDHELDYLLRCENLTALAHSIVKDFRLLFAQLFQLAEQAKALCTGES